MQVMISRLIDMLVLPLDKVNTEENNINAAIANNAEAILLSFLLSPNISVATLPIILLQPIEELGLFVFFCLYTILY